MKKIMYPCIMLSLISMQCLGIDIVGLDGRKGVYDSATKTAFLDSDGHKTVYTDVVEYSQAVTPPTVGNPNMKAFATMPNPRYRASIRRLVGGQKKTVTLYGIPKESTEVNQESFEIMRKVTKEEKTFEIFGTKGSYDPETKTAYLIDVQGNKKEYTNVVEYRQAVTPPSVGNPNMKAFATMPNPRYAKSDIKLAGGQFKNITLYGIEKKSDDDFVDDLVIKSLRY